MRTSSLIVGLLVATVASARPMEEIRSANLEPARGGKPRPPVMVPPDATNNLALACSVAASAEPTLWDRAEHQTPLGDLPCITDGNKEHDDEHVNLPTGTQWVQLDLGKTQEVWAVQVWHWYDYGCAYRDVVVQLSKDPDFIDGVVTVFNNDHDNSSGLGVGKEYIECYQGRAIEVDGVCARYLRFYSNGCTETPVNRYTEIEVYGRASIDRDRSRQDTPRVRLRIELPKPIFM